MVQGGGAAVSPMSMYLLWAAFSLLRPTSDVFRTFCMTKPPRRRNSLFSWSTIPASSLALSFRVASLVRETWVGTSRGWNMG